MLRKNKKSDLTIWNPAVRQSDVLRRHVTVIFRQFEDTRWHCNSTHLLEKQLEVGAYELEIKYCFCLNCAREKCRGGYMELEKFMIYI